MRSIDITLLTDSRYVNPVKLNWYVQNILEDDRLLTEAFQKKGLRVTRTNWDNPTYQWNETRYALFRTTWDYFDRFTEFSKWLDQTSQQTTFINPIETIRWNIDKHYLADLQKDSVNIPPTIFIKQGDQRTLQQIVSSTGWATSILKPAISGSARHTYKLTVENLNNHESIFRDLISVESMLLQEFQQRVISQGEVALMVFGGTYSHAVLKKAKPGDFRVQDDFGGSVHEYEASHKEIEFAERVVSCIKPVPLYARVDVIWDNPGNICVSELELIEPELWFRKHPAAADLFATKVADHIR